MLDLALFRSPAFVGAQIDRVRALVVDVRDVPLPDALPPEHPRATRRSRPGVRFLPLSLRVVLRGAARRPADRAACRSVLLLGVGLALNAIALWLMSRAHADLALDRAPPRASSSAGSGIGFVNAAARDDRHLDGAARAAGDRRQGSTTPSARSASRPGSRRSARSSSIRSPPCAADHAARRRAPGASFVSGLNDILWSASGSPPSAPFSPSLLVRRQGLRRERARRLRSAH